MDKPVVILLVCTGNTCRSSMAEALAQKILGRPGKNNKAAEIVSAGTHAPIGSPASYQAVRVMKDMEIDLTNHRASQVTPELVNRADYIFTMTKAQKEMIQTALPDDAGRVFTLKEFAGLAGDIMDPFGGAEEVYRLCAEDLSQTLEMVMEKILGKTEEKE